MKRLLIALGVAAAIAVAHDASAQSFNQNSYATPFASVSGGGLPYHTISTATTNATVVKSGKGTVYSISALNPNAWPTAYLHFYDKGTTPVCGTDVPVLTYGLPQNVPVETKPPVGVQFLNGIAFCVTAGASDNDSSVALAGVVINLTYK